MKLRVVQWTTGKTGGAAVRGMVGHPALELVGCYAYSPEKVGEDVGVLAGIEPIGIRATDDIDALLALGPDCVAYMPFRPDFDHVVRILESGVNIVTTMYMLAGRGYGDDVHERIEDATRRGQSSLYASGIYPGHANMVALAASAMCTRLDCVSVLESLDMSGYANEQMFRAMGIDRALDDPGSARARRRRVRIVQGADPGDGAVRFRSSSTRIRFDVEFGAANRTDRLRLHDDRGGPDRRVQGGAVGSRRRPPARPVQVRVEGRPRHDTELARRGRLRHRDRGRARRAVPARADRPAFRRSDHHCHARVCTRSRRCARHRPASSTTWIFRS